MNRPMNRPGQVPSCACPRSAPVTCQASVSLTEWNQELKQLPLAMAYVPIQSWSEPYAAGRALCRGTIFPVLDLPFGEVNGL